jgi:peptidoglycan/xylan/chitin deacetylase (PgdA/CDA1 family)
MYPPVLMYHEVIKDVTYSREMHTVTLADFKWQMRYLRELRAGSIDFEGDFQEGVLSGRKDDHQIGISFDDGHLSDFSEAMPVLDECGFRGVFFITLDWVGKPGHVGWEEIRMMNEAGMSIQSHGVTHRFLPRLNDAQLRAELRGSKLALEDRLGREVRILALPGGFGSKRVFLTAKEEGYSAVFTSEPCSYDTIRGNFGIIGRFNVTRLTSDDAFKGMVHLDRNFIRKLRRAHRAKSIVKSLVGSELYHRMWRIFKRELRR